MSKSVLDLTVGELVEKVVDLGTGLGQFIARDDEGAALLTVMVGLGSRAEVLEEVMGTMLDDLGLEGVAAGVFGPGDVA